MTQTNTVLIVDDFEVNVALMCALVDRVEGLQSIGFTDPEAALRWCENAHPILIILDYEMPGIDGAQFVTRLRATERGGIIPVVIVTAHTDRATLLKVFNAGANDFIRKPVDEIELTVRVRSMAQLGQATRQIAALANTDELTGFKTRRRFLTRLHEEMTRSRRYAMPLSLVVFDLDHFKRINDSGGHAAGDEVLREIGRRTRGFLREVDFAGRLGGEEFGWALPSISLANAVTAANRLRRLIEVEPFLENRAVTASFGVATLEATDDPSTLLNRADQNMYLAKNAGRNQVLSLIS